VEVCPMVDQAKIALPLGQNWNWKNEVIDLKKTKISKNHYVKRTLFQIHSNKFYFKK